MPFANNVKVNAFFFFWVCYLSCILCACLGARDWKGLGFRAKHECSFSIIFIDMCTLQIDMN